jgi:hypothetical protein
LNCLVACRRPLSELGCLYLQYVVIQQHLCTEELFSQLRIVYCCYVIAKSKWSIGIQPNFYVNSILSSWGCEEGASSFSLFLCLQNSQLINCNFKGTMGLTISQLVLSFGFYVWKQSNVVHEKQFYCNMTYVQEMCTMSCCLVKQQSRLMCMLAMAIGAICLVLSSLEPYLCMC